MIVFQKKTLKFMAKKMIYHWIIEIICHQETQKVANLAEN